MTPPVPTPARRAPYQAVLLVLLAFLAFRTYSRDLTYYFTATDSFTVIETSRISSADDLASIFSRPLMSGSTFTHSALYYRPITSLSYALDYAFWGLDPFGYHLSNLFFQVLVCIGVFLLLGRLFGGTTAIGWWGAVFFASHPILVEVIPAISRRHDILSTLFLIGMLIAFDESRRNIGKRRLLIAGGLMCFALAVGSKEIAFIGPALVFLYAMLIPAYGTSSWKERAGAATRAALPYASVLVAILAWRIAVLGSLGGVLNRHWDPPSIVQHWVVSSRDFFADLLYPIPFLSGSAPWWVSAVAALVALGICLEFVWGAGFAGEVSLRRRRWGSAGFAAAAVFIAATLAYPLYSGPIETIVERSYQVGGGGVLGATMESRSSLSLEFYLMRAREIVTTLFWILAFLSAAAGAWVVLGRRIRDRLETSQNARAVMFLLSWLVLYLVLFHSTLTFDHRDMYAVPVPFAGLLAAGVYLGVRKAVRIARAKRSVPSGDKRIRGELMRPVAWVAPAAVACSLMWFSPLIRDYGEWEASGLVSEALFDALPEVVSKAPEGTILRIRDLPAEIREYRESTPHAKTVSYLADYSVKSWLDMQYPEVEYEVVLEGRSTPESFSDSLSFQSTMVEPGVVEIVVRFDAARRP